MTEFADILASVRAKIAAACAKAGRDPSEVEIVAVTKKDLPEAEATRKRFADELNIDAFLISAVTGDGLKELVEKIDQILKPKTRW